MEDIMKYSLFLLVFLILLSGCSAKKDPSAALVHHMKNVEKIFEKNKSDTSVLSKELSAYAETNMESMQGGIKALNDKMGKVKDDPLGAFDLLSKVTEISSIIVRIRTNYGSLLEDPAVQKAFEDYGKIFESMENIGRSR
jgi:PBP1b-binding outer membrane lipoprotein LpoB